MTIVAQNPAGVKPIQVHPVQAHLAPKLYPHGQPLAERAGAATMHGKNAYCFEFESAGDECVWGCYEVDESGHPARAAKYALETVRDSRAGDVVTHCNCPDRAYRRRVCRHMVELAVFLGTGLRTPGGSLVVAASAVGLLRHTPRTLAEALRDDHESYTDAVTRAVILTAREAEGAENLGAENLEERR